MRNNALRRDIEESATSFRLEQHYTIPELQQALKISRQALYRYIQDGYLKALSVGAEWRISQSAIDDFVNRYLFRRNPRVRAATPKGRRKRRLEVSLPHIRLDPEGSPPPESATAHGSTS